MSFGKRKKPVKKPRYKKPVKKPRYKKPVKKPRYKKPVKSRTTRFGNVIPQINTLKMYGKNFPDGQGFKISNSFQEEITKKWGDPLLSGTLGREFGPGNTDKIYDNNYFNNIRMAYPGGDLETTLSLNRACNQYNSVPSPSSPQSADPVVNYP